MTQEELVKKSGLSLTTVHRVENGESSPHLETILILCETLKCSSDYLLGLRIRNYDDVMQDPKTANIVRMFLRFDDTFKNRVLEYIKFVSESVIPKGL